eukprot:jgi/Psemu1/35637/gm1.35637_g
MVGKPTSTIFPDNQNPPSLPTVSGWEGGGTNKCDDSEINSTAAYINVITPDPDAKETMIAAFKHQHMVKPMDTTEHSHFSRIDTILNYIDMLPGDGDNDLMEQHRKRMFF